MSEASDSADTAKATYDSANDYKIYAYRGLMLQIREEINTIRTNVVLSLSSITEATWITNVKAKINTDAGLDP